jgi:cytochrome c biogenesis protein CcmG/thiol:disulfide interchange protein DsbE
MLLLSNSLFAANTDAPPVDLPTINGKVSLEQLKGKVVYIDFWASWCLPCKKSFPWMHEMKEKYAEKGFEIIAINLDKNKQLADEFLDNVNVNFIVAFDQAGDTASLYQLRGMPSSYLIGRDGKLYAAHTGFRDKDKDELEKLIKNQLQQ